MEKINTDYKRRIWKIEVKLFNMRNRDVAPLSNDDDNAMDDVYPGVLPYMYYIGMCRVIE